MDAESFMGSHEGGQQCCENGAEDDRLLRSHGRDVLRMWAQPSVGSEPDRCRTGRASILAALLVLVLGPAAYEARRFRALSSQGPGRTTGIGGKSEVEAGVCSAPGADCRASKCCSDIGLSCFEKNQYWASCLPSCAPGEHEEDPPSSRGPWSCKPLGAVAEAPMVIEDRYWMMCTGPGACVNANQMQRWHESPTSLADKVKGFDYLPGAQRSAEAVLAHWRMAPPALYGRQVTLQDLADFARDLLTSDPFGTGDMVPFVDMEMPWEGMVVAITQRQLAFLVVNALMGNGIDAGDGLAAALQRCSARSGRRLGGEASNDTAAARQTQAGVAPTGIVFSLLSMLAVLSQELRDGGQGSMLVAAKPTAAGEGWRQRLQSHVMLEPSICAEQAGGPGCGLKDFMAGGTNFQAMTDIAGGAVGGGGGLCDLANTQEESLVQFYGEVLAFSFFAAGRTKMLPVPVAFLGTRRYMSFLSGETDSGVCGYIKQQNWLNEGIRRSFVNVGVGLRTVPMVASSFVAVASKCIACFAQSCTVDNLMNNKCDVQRRHLDEDVGLWYGAYESSLYNGAIQGAFRSVVRRIGTGPWGAGDWRGDSQQSFLAVWLASSLLNGVSLDYYVYSRFCENAGNQCLVLDEQACKACLWRTYPWQGTAGKLVSESSCAGPGVHETVQRFRRRSVAELRDALLKVSDPSRSVFSSVASKR